jgi:hypothetical protein
MPTLRIRPWMVALVVCSVYVVIVIIRHNGDSLALVTIGTQFSQGIPEESGGTEGYDGQFVYYIARDPVSASQHLDVPAYRFQRILLPISARILAFGQEALLPWSLLFINLASLAIGTLILENLLQQYEVNRWYALTYGLTIGIAGSVRLSLPEPLAYSLVLAGILLMSREKWLLGSVAFAFAGLAKETTLLFPAAYIMYHLVRRKWHPAIILVLSFVPFALWQIILYIQIGAFGIGSGGAKATPFEAIPFAGIARIITEVPAAIRLEVLIIFGAILLPFVILPTLWALKKCWADRANRAVYLYLLFANAAIMLFVPFSTYREPIGILRFIVGLQIVVILYAASRHNIRVLRYTTLWITTALFMVSLA